jgi:SAM-dependent methyltransferase
VNHLDHVSLLRDGIPQPGGLWADFGSGDGAFTLALADLLGRDGTIYAVDNDRSALQRQQQTMRGRFPHTTVYYRTADFTTPLDLPPLDGIVMANALHFLRHKEATLRLIHDYLQPAGRFILVEYNTDRGNPWVPYPLSYPTWQSLAQRAGFSQTQLLATHPSRFLGEIFSALSLK